MSALSKYTTIKYLGKGSYGSALLVCLAAEPSQRFVMKEVVIGHLKPEGMCFPQTLRSSPTIAFMFVNADCTPIYNK